MGRDFHISALKLDNGSNGAEIVLLMGSFNSEKERC